MGKYTTYENKPNQRVCIHKLPCDEVRKYGGLGQGLYKEFHTFEEAEDYAKSLKYKIYYCQKCIKNIQNKYSCEENMDIVEEKEFKLNGTVYIARKYKGTKRDIIYKESREVVKNIKGIARGYLKQFNENVSTDANVMNTYNAVNLLMKYC